MTDAAKPGESNWTLSNLSEFLSAQKSKYLRAAGEGAHKEVWTISMGNEAGGKSLLIPVFLINQRQSTSVQISTR
jgi:hypothetical protein